LAFFAVFLATECLDNFQALVLKWNSQGANAPEYESSQERKFMELSLLGNESSTAELSFPGAKLRCLNEIGTNR